jgi:hypothetical protein
LLRLGIILMLVVAGLPFLVAAVRSHGKAG